MFTLSDPLFLRPGNSHGSWIMVQVQTVQSFFFLLLHDTVISKGIFRMRFINITGNNAVLTLLRSEWPKLYGNSEIDILTLLHSEQPKLYGVLAILSAVGLTAK